MANNEILDTGVNIISEYDQVLINGLVAGSGYALVAVGFGLIYATVRFFHFAHGAVVTAAAYAAYVFTIVAGWPLPLAVGVAVLIAMLLGVLMEVVVYRRLRKVGATPLIHLVASLGIFVGLQGLVSVIFGEDTYVLRLAGSNEGMHILGARVTPVQLIIIVTSLVAALVAELGLRLTRIGRMIRALASDPELARIMGVPEEQLIIFVFAIGSALAAIAGILFGYDTDVTPALGFRSLMMGVVAAIIGGVGSIPGAVLGGLFIGFAQHLGILWLPTQWQDAIVFLVLILVLLLRPQGFLGKPLRKATV